MIASIDGEVQALGAGWVVVSIGGLGVRVEVPEGRLRGAHVGAAIFLHTNLVVREDSLTLFGFSTPEELEVFGVLLGVSGVGARSALGVLAVLTPAQVARAVQLEDDSAFRKVSGIGPKTAKLLVVSLAGKLQPQRFLAAETQHDAHAAVSTTVADTESAVSEIVVQGLVGLGYPESHAENAVADAQRAGATSEHSALLRAALALLQAPRPAGKRNENGR